MLQLESQWGVSCVSVGQHAGHQEWSQLLRGGVSILHGCGDAGSVVYLKSDCTYSYMVVPFCSGAARDDY